MTYLFVWEGNIRRFLAKHSRYILSIIGPFHEPLQLSFIVNMKVSNMQAFFSFAFPHLIILFLKQLTLAPIICIHQLGLPHKFKLYTLLYLLTLRRNKVEMTVFTESIIPPLEVKSSSMPIFLQVIFYLLYCLHRFLYFI